MTTKATVTAKPIQILSEKSYYELERLITENEKLKKENKQLRITIDETINTLKTMLKNYGKN